MCMYESICIRMWRTRANEFSEKERKRDSLKASLVVESILISYTEAPKRFTMPRLIKAHAGGKKRRDGTKE